MWYFLQKQEKSNALVGRRGKDKFERGLLVVSDLHVPSRDTCGDNPKGGECLTESRGRGLGHRIPPDLIGYSLGDERTPKELARLKQAEEAEWVDEVRAAFLTLSGIKGEHYEK